MVVYRLWVGSAKGLNRPYRFRIRSVSVLERFWIGSVAALYKLYVTFVLVLCEFCVGSEFDLCCTPTSLIAFTHLVSKHNPAAYTYSGVPVRDCAKCAAVYLESATWCVIPFSSFPLHIPKQILSTESPLFLKLLVMTHGGSFLNYVLPSTDSWVHASGSRTHRQQHTSVSPKLRTRTATSVP